MNTNYRVNMNKLNAEDKLVQLHKLAKDPSPKDLLLAGGIITIYRLDLTRSFEKSNRSFTPRVEKTFSVEAPEGTRDDTFNDLCAKVEKEFYLHIFKDLVWDPHMYYIVGTVFDRGVMKTLVFDGWNNIFVSTLSDDTDVSVKISRRYLPEIINIRELYYGYPGRYINDTGEVVTMTEEEWDEILKKIIIAMKINQIDNPYCLDLEDFGYTDLRKAADEGNKLFGQFLGDL